MKSLQRTLTALSAAIFLAGAAGLWRAKVSRSPAAPAVPAREDSGWTSLERKTLLNLDVLLAMPQAAAFKKDLDARPELKAALSAGPGPDAVRDFKALVAKHAQDEAFRKALESPAAPEQPCAGPETVKKALLASPKPAPAAPIREDGSGCVQSPPSDGKNDLLPPAQTSLY